MQRLESKERKARKSHSCDYCGGVIKPGEKYSWDKLVGDDGIYEWHQCHRCMKYVNECFAKDYNDCCSEGLDGQIFMDFMYEYHPEIAKDWFDN